MHPQSKAEITRQALEEIALAEQVENDLYLMEDIDHVLESCLNWRSDPAALWVAREMLERYS